MNKRYSDSLVNDPNLRITISLTGVVIFNQISDTPWTNTTSLGAFHDGTGDSVLCPASANNMMTNGFGLFNSTSYYLTFSNCSINSFKKTLLSHNMKFV